MKFYSVAQCSYLDKEFGFDPQWLLDYGHLEDLVEQLREAGVGEDEEVHFVTSDQPEDDELAARLEELADGVKRVDKEAYVGDGMVELLEGLEDEAGVVLTSAYLAILPVDFLQTAKLQLFKNDQGLIRFSNKMQINQPSIARNKIIRECIADNCENHCESQNRREDFKALWMINSCAPFWIFPPRLNFPMRWNPEVEWEVIKPQNNLFEKQREKSHRLYIMSENGAITWKKIKNNTENLYSSIVDEAHEKMIGISPVPLAVQLDISAEESLWYDFEYEQQADLDFKVLADRLNEVSKKAKLFQTYLQIGNYWDPCANEKLIEFLEMLDRDGLRMGLYTRGENLNSQLAEKLVNLTDEIFFYFGQPEKNGNKNDRIDKYQLLWETRFEKHQRLSGGPYKTMPIISAVYEVAEKGKVECLNELISKWTDYQKAKEKFQEKNSEFNFEEFYKYYFLTEDLKTWNLIFKLPPHKMAENNHTEYVPLERFPCRRIKEGVFISPSGTIKPCDISLKSTERLGQVKEDSLLDLWGGEQRRKFLAKQKSSNKCFSICDQCCYWFQPII